MQITRNKFRYYPNYSIIYDIIKAKMASFVTHFLLLGMISIVSQVVIVRELMTAFFGAFLPSLFFIPLFGIQKTILLLVAFNFFNLF